MTKPVPPLKPTSLGHLLNRDMPEREYLIEPLLRQGESAMVWAAPGVGKTMFTLSLALAVAGGGTFLGWKSPKPWRVLFIDGEMPMQDLQERLRMLSSTIEGIDMDAACDNLVILARHDQDPDTPFPDLNDEKLTNELLGKIRHDKFDLVILDNLSTLAFLDDENSSSAVTPVVKFLQKIKQSNIGCIVVHHSGKSGKDYRGSSNLATTFEVILGLTAINNILDTHQGAAFRTEFTKVRNFRDETMQSREIRLSTIGGKSEWLAVADEDETLKAIVAVIRSGECSKQADIAKHLPRMFWPNEDTPPSVGWISNRVREIKAKEMMHSSVIKEAMSGSSEYDPENEDDLNPDF